MNIAVGDWVRYYACGKLEMGVVIGFQRRVTGSVDVLTDTGAIDKETIIEARAGAVEISYLLEDPR